MQQQQPPMVQIHILDNGYVVAHALNGQNRSYVCNDITDVNMACTNILEEYEDGKKDTAQPSAK